MRIDGAILNLRFGPRNGKKFVIPSQRLTNKIKYYLIRAMFITNLLRCSLIIGGVMVGFVARLGLFWTRVRTWP